MPNISKEKIELAIKGLQDGVDALFAITILQGLLDQPEAEPVAWQIKFKDEHGTQRSVTYTHNAIGDYRQIDPDAICEPLYTHPAPFTPISADMVTDEMCFETGEDKEKIVSVVNAYNLTLEKL